MPKARTYGAPAPSGETSAARAVAPLLEGLAIR
jgi:hypothetical protein